MDTATFLERILLKRGLITAPIDNKLDPTDAADAVIAERPALTVVLDNAKYVED